MLTGRRIRYEQQPRDTKTAHKKTSDPHACLFKHTMVADVTHTGIQQTIKAGTIVTVTATVPCANGVWFRTKILDTPIWFLGSGQSRSYTPIYQTTEEEEIID